MEGTDCGTDGGTGCGWAQGLGGLWATTPDRLCGGAGGQRFRVHEHLTDLQSASGARSGEAGNMGQETGSSSQQL